MFFNRYVIVVEMPRLSYLEQIATKLTAWTVGSCHDFGEQTEARLPAEQVHKVPAHPEQVRQWQAAPRGVDNGLHI